MHVIERTKKQRKSDFFRDQKSEEIARAASLMQTAIEAMIYVYSEEF